MIKTLQNTLKQDKEHLSVPKSVQDTIPIRRLWPDGLFQFGGKFSKTVRFSDINYAIASKEDKTSMFLGYSELLNALDTGSTTKITINNKRLNRRNFEQEILIPPQGDHLDGGRSEYNAMLLDKVTDSSNSMVQERYVTVSAHKKTPEEARTFFDRVMNDVTTRLNHLDSHCDELDAVERLRVLHDFYRVGEESRFHIDLQECMKTGRSFKDAICPDSMEFRKDHFIMGNKYGRAMFLKEYASYIKDSMIHELTSLNRTMMLSIDVIPVPTDEAVREMQNRLLGVETNVTNWQRRQNSNNNFSAVVPYDLEQQRKETREMLDDLTTRDQRMMFAVVTLVHLADSKEELDSDTETLQSIARKHLCQLDHSELAAGRGPCHRPPHRTAADRRPAHPDHRSPGRPHALQSPGDPGPGRHLLRPECHQQKSHHCRPQAAPQRQRICSGRVRLRQILYRQAGDYRPGPLYPG